MKPLTKKEMNLLMFAEWLDADQQLVKKTKKGDLRTWVDLVQQYLQERKGEQK